MSDIVKSTGSALSDKTYLDRQFELLKKFGLPPTSAEHHVVKVEVVDGKERYTLAKREQPIKIFDDGDHGLSIARTCRTGADKVRLNQKRGKYNDEDTLPDGQLYGSERRVGDVEQWSAM